MKKFSRCIKKKFDTKQIKDCFKFVVLINLILRHGILESNY